MERMIYDYQDKHIHLKKIIQSLGEVYESFNTYLQEELYHGRVAARVHKFVQRELNVLLKDMASPSAAHGSARSGSAGAT